MNRLDRITALLVALQSRSEVRAADCAERFGVSVRTIYRDIRTLESAGVPVCGDAGVGYSLVDGFRLPPLMFTPEEALAFLTAEKFIEQMTDPEHSAHFRGAMDKIRAVMRGSGRQYIEDLDDRIAVYRSRRTPEVRVASPLQTLLRGASERRVLNMSYKNAEGHASTRAVEVVGVAWAHPCWYAAAWCHLRGEYRTFRLDRIESLEPTAMPHTRANHPPLKKLMDHENKDIVMKINSIEIRELAPVEVVALRHTGDYSGIAAAFERIGAWAAQNNYWPLGPRMMGIYHDDPQTTPPDELRSSAALEALPGMEPGPGMMRYTVTGGKYLVMTAEVTMAEYGAAWSSIYTEVATRGLREDLRDHYELYVSCVDSTQGPDAPWIVEFRVPVK